jgi:3D (Asp-Asp-Asp) domain-containing protein
LKVHIFSGSALVVIALLGSYLVFTNKTLSAETLSPPQTQSTKLASSNPEASAPVAAPAGRVGEMIAVQEAYVVPPVSYVATAYSLRGRTASGRMVAKGLIAADPRHLPLGSRVRLEAGAYSGEYLVADTGTMVRGKRIDIWTPTSREAMRFGRRVVKLTVLSLPTRKRATSKI